jgi:hypothetical protein
MKVKELITQLLEYDMNAEVRLTTTDESRMKSFSPKKNNVVFSITGTESWGRGSVDIAFDDWRQEEGDV